VNYFVEILADSLLQLPLI